ncbi:uncharacterized protein LOC126894808 [Daktulosphaira vitifoliae]|uniref:uncharacterized protein LOC126894808 n=1 Tax=Daktulosphaira vitifoliae TaxID=58002 RepID=UPI0021AA8E34|nr:uncharacterized protein LOC126894808 [Daktulosphaira vitifoliae]
MVKLEELKRSPYFGMGRVCFTDYVAKQPPAWKDVKKSTPQKSGKRKAEESPVPLGKGDKAKVVMFTRKRIGLDSLDTLTLNGQEISLKSEVKYLGIILDSKLKWKSHVESRIKKAMTPLWTCSRALGKTWGLKPRVMYWLYTSVIKPMILYGALVWWTRTALITARKELSRIQRMAAIAITGALRTTPTVALEALIGLPPLHLEVKAHAKATALRFHNLGMWTLESDTTEHGKILKEIDKGFLEYPLDYIKPVLKNNIPYKVEITTRIEWNINHLTDKGGFVIYTDGSKKSGKVGAGIWGLKPRINVSMSLGTTPSVFQAEVMAILVEAQNLLVHKNRKITILSDSQAALKALCNDQVNSKLVLECRETLESLSRFTKVTLAWVPGHNGLTGNENADFLC